MLFSGVSGFVFVYNDLRIFRFWRNFIEYLKKWLTSSKRLDFMEKCGYVLFMAGSAMLKRLENVSDKSLINQIIEENPPPLNVGCEFNSWAKDVAKKYHEQALRELIPQECVDIEMHRNASKVTDGVAWIGFKMGFILGSEFVIKKIENPSDLSDLKGEF